MSMSNKWIVGIALSCVFQVGCVSKVAQQEQYTGFLPNYQGLEEQTTQSEQKVMRWVAPGFAHRPIRSVQIAAIHKERRERRSQAVKFNSLLRVIDSDFPAIAGSIRPALTCLLYTSDAADE